MLFLDGFARRHHQTMAISARKSREKGRQDHLCEITKRLPAVSPMTSARTPLTSKTYSGNSNTIRIRLMKNGVIISNRSWAATVQLKLNHEPRTARRRPQL